MKSYLSLLILLFVATYGTTTHAQTGAALDFDGTNDCAVLFSNNTSNWVGTGGVTSGVNCIFTPIRYYVNDAVTTSGDGKTWANAFKTLQEALETTDAEEIWVAGGTYKPTANPDNCSSCQADNRSYAFWLKNNVKIYGSFAGTETTLAQRTPSVRAANPTILSGDIGTIGDESDNSYHVVVARQITDATTVFDGFTVRDGNANSGGSTYIGSFYIGQSGGGGMYLGSSNLTVSNCIFTDNKGLGGGGAHVLYGAPTFTSCVFTQNMATFSSFNGGGGLSMSNATTVSNSVFYGNTSAATERGGAISINDNGTGGATLTNVTITGNSSGIWSSTAFTLTNSIIWNNTNNTTPINLASNGQATVSYSTMENGYAGTGNVSANPNFKDANNPKGTDNQWFTADDGLFLGCQSSAFNAGTNTGAPTTDPLGTARPQFGTADMGAYENTFESVPQITFTGNTTGCNQVTLTANAGDTYTWDGGNSLNTAQNTFTTSGTYSVSVTNSTTGCTATKSVVVTINPPPTIGFTGATTACDAVNLTATMTPTPPLGAGGYAWSGGATPSVASNRFINSGTYTVTVTDANGCVATQSVPVTVNKVAASVTGTTTACVQVNLTASGGDTYVWSGGATPSVATNNFTATGNYTVTVTNTTTGCVGTANVGVTINGLPSVAITGTRTACANVSLTATGANTYVWSGGATPSVSSNNFTTIGTYAVSVTGTNTTTGCMNTASANIQVVALPTIGFVSTDLDCQTTQVTASGGNTYVWSGGATPNTAVNTFTTAGIYTVTVTNTTTTCVNSANLSVAISGASRRYVNIATSNTMQDGLSWATAYKNLQTAINSCVANNAEIWVAKGTYTPTHDPYGNAAPTDLRYRTFYLKNTLKIYGGFDGTETALSQRNFVNNPTILSGDFNGDDVGASNIAENAYHVVLSVNDDNTTVLDGFTITAGNTGLGANTTVETFSISNAHGGGMYNDRSAVRVVNTIISDNRAYEVGGGMYNYLSNMTLSNVVFSANVARTAGGGIYNSSSSPTLTNVVFSANVSPNVGGGVYNNGSSPNFTNVTFNANYGYQGGAFYNLSGSTVFKNAVIYGNFGSLNPNIYDIPNTISATYSAIEGGLTGTGNISTNPNFANTTTPKGTDGKWLTADDGLRLGCNSPAYNTGTNTGAPTTDIVGTNRPQFTTVDMGAYESSIDVSTAASASITGPTVGCGSLSLTASGGVSYAWSGGTTPSVASNIFSNSGTYTVTVTNAAACTATASQTITVRLLPTLSIVPSPSAAIVSGTNVTFTATPKGHNSTPQYQWYLNNVAVGTNSATYSNAALVNNDVVKCILTTTDSCGNSGTFTSNLVTMIVCSRAITYVKPVASGTGDGSSWANATNNVQDAINNACTGLSEIWVAAGTYKPTRDPFGNATPSVNRSKTFMLRNGVKIYGGFAGTEGSRSERNWTNNVTILSGDFNDNDVVSGMGSNLSFSGNAENAYHVVLAIDADNTTILDGLTIKSGNGGVVANTTVGGYAIADASGNGLYGERSNLTLTNVIFTENNGNIGVGGAIFLRTSSPTISNCTFSKNKAVYGGAIMNEPASEPVFSNCTFLGNNGSNGGAIFSNTGTKITMSNSTFTGNYAVSGGALSVSGATGAFTNTHFMSNAVSSQGGAIRNTGSALYFAGCHFLSNVASFGGVSYTDNTPSAAYYDCVFSNNTAYTFGGVLYNDRHTPSSVNCIFNGNYANYGGVAYNNTSSKPAFVNSTLTNNSASSYGGIFYNLNQSDPNLKNCIVWNNSSIAEDNVSTLTRITYSIVQGGYAGEGNRADDPLFLNAANPIGTDGIWRTADDGLQLQSTSPARDAGTNTGAPTLDILGFGIFNSTKDMGAYEFQHDVGVYSGSAACQSVSVANVSGNQWFHFQHANGIIASINPNGMNMGTVTAEVSDPSGALAFNNNTFLGRTIKFTSSAYTEGSLMPTNYTMKLYYYDTELTEYNTAIVSSYQVADLNMAWQRNNAACGLGNSTAGGTVAKSTITSAEYGTNNNGFYIEFPLNHFTVFAATTAGGAVLPVEILNFSGYTEGSSNRLVWTTANEINNKGFQIERLNCRDTRPCVSTWESMGFVNSKGNTATYQFTDKSPLRGLGAYRLRQIDNDGKETLSKIISLSNTVKSSLKVYPNPATDVLTVDAVDTHGRVYLQFQIINLLGQIILRGPLNQVVDVSALPNGTYFVKVGLEQVKFVKQ
jgi:hypothetical protein